MAGEAGEIFIIHHGVGSSAGTLNQIGVFGAKQQFGISFSQETLLNNNIRAILQSSIEKGIYTIPSKSAINGVIHVVRRF